jgi:hypothetical protein
MDTHAMQAAADRLVAKLDSLDLDADERTLLVALLASGATSVEPTDDVAGFAFGSLALLGPPLKWSGPGDEGPEETITFTYGGVSAMYKPQRP